jgi:2-methylcitrate dehydratase PrpD
MEVTTELARRIRAINYENLPRQVVSNAKVAILDTVGVTLAGSQEDSAKLLMRVPGMSEPGPSLVFGHAMRTSALNAALINGTSAHAMDFDDVNIALGGHPSAPLTPALFALAETMHASGRDLIAAFIAGFETTTRVARGVNYLHYEKGWHPTATLGVFGVAAACAHLLKLDEEQTATAIATAVSLASGVKANFGTMTKPMHVGHCARSGLFAAYLAQQGYTANTGAFEHKQGYLNVFNGPEQYDVNRIFEGWGAPYDIDQPGLGIKLYPCCGSTHGPIDGMLTLAAKHDIKPEDIERIDLSLHARRILHVNRPDPRSGLDAKFSVQYCMARALVDRKVTVDHFENDAYADARVQTLLPKIHVERYTTPPTDKSDNYRVEMSVTLRSGQKHSHTQERPTGRTPDDPIPPERVQSKFESCAARAVGTAGAGRLLSALEKLDTVPNVRELVASIQPSTSK